MTLQNERGTARHPIEEPMTEEARGVSPAFGAWLAALDVEAGRRGYGPKLTQTTGPECWREMFDDGMTPAEALDEDEANA